MNPIEEFGKALKEALFGGVAHVTSIALANPAFSAAVKVLLLYLLGLSIWRFVRFFKFIGRL